MELNRTAECMRPPPKFLLIVEAGRIVVDTTTGQGCMGIEEAMSCFVHPIAKYGERCVYVERDLSPVAGIKRKTKPLGFSMVPTGIEEAHGVVGLVNLVQTIAPLMPVRFIMKLQSQCWISKWSA